MSAAPCWLACPLQSGPRGRRKSGPTSAPTQRPRCVRAAAPLTRQRSSQRAFAAPLRFPRTRQR
eukprot:1493230-Lingulodinium_polyedra.AAC.1